MQPSTAMQNAQPTPKPGALAHAAPTGETASAVLAAQAKALVEARFTIAHYQPRDIDAVRERLLKECARPSFAEVAIYRKPIGQGVEGPSIRFAEAAMQAMGNLAIDTPAIYDDSEKRILRVTVADMETNVTHSKDVTIAKRVERSKLSPGQVALKTRTNSRGQPVYLVEATDDEILNTENALVSKALRTTGLRLVPGWLIDECLSAVRATRAKEHAVDPDAAKRKLLDAFRGVGVSAEQVKEWLGHPGEALTPGELEELRGIYTAIKDGDTNWREVMAERNPDAQPAGAAGKSKTENLRERVKRMADATAKQQQTPAAEAAGAPIVDPETGETWDVPNAG